MLTPIESCWNAGMTLSEASRSMPALPKRTLVATWKRLRKTYGCSCVPLRFTSTQNSDPAYLSWKGITGPGMLLRQLIAASNAEKQQQSLHTV